MTTYNQRFSGLDRGQATEIQHSYRYGRLDHVWSGRHHEVRDALGRVLLGGTREECIAYIRAHGGAAAAHAV